MYYLFVSDLSITVAINEVRQDVWRSFTQIIGRVVAISSEIVTYSVFVLFWPTILSTAYSFPILLLNRKAGLFYLALIP